MIYECNPNYIFNISGDNEDDNDSFNNDYLDEENVDDPPLRNS